MNACLENAEEFITSKKVVMNLVLSVPLIGLVIMHNVYMLCYYCHSNSRCKRFPCYRLHFVLVLVLFMPSCLDNFIR